MKQIQTFSEITCIEDVLPAKGFEHVIYKADGSIIVHKWYIMPPGTSYGYDFDEDRTDE